MNSAHVMIIRHGEKPSADGTIAGVTTDGDADPNELSVRGWQRAGALVRFFAPIAGAPLRPGIATPAHVFAQRPVDHARAFVQATPWPLWPTCWSWIFG